MEALLDAIVKLARDLPSESVEALATAIECETEPATAASTVAGLVSAPAAQERVRTLFSAWSASEGVTTAAIALSLRAANRMDDHHRLRQRIELVWTGPVPAGTVFRRSDQVLLEMVREAAKRVIIVSFATYRVPAVHHALGDALKRGVEVVFIVESREESEGRVKVDPVAAIGAELATNARIYVWPRDRRPTDEDGNFGLLHAKCAIADGKRLLVSSANFTTAALEKNMELGLLIEGGNLPAVVAAHWDALRVGGVLREICA